MPPGLTLIPVAIIAARAAVKPPSAKSYRYFSAIRMIATFIGYKMAAMFMASFEAKDKYFSAGYSCMGWWYLSYHCSIGLVSYFD